MIALPIENFSIITGAIKVYSNWLLEPSLRPIIIKQERGSQVEQKFFQVTLYTFLYLAVTRFLIGHFLAFIAYIPSPSAI